jgi:hypothetical protein
LAAVLSACTGQEPGPVQSVAPAYTEPVAAPGGGTVDDIAEGTPAPVDVTTVALDETADVGGDVSARVDSVEPLSVEAKTPGEIAGPAVAVTITITNDGKDAIDVAAAMVSLVDAADVLGQPTTSDPYRPFDGSIQPGSSAQAVYVFLLAKDAQSAFDVSVQYRAGTTVAHFIDE